MRKKPRLALNFGYIPGLRKGHREWLARLFGNPNLLKRLQAADLINALQLDPTHLVLDAGCSANPYFSAGIAPFCRKVIGVDINPSLRKYPGLRRIRGSVELVRGSVLSLPFTDNVFDRVFASEILPMIPEPAQAISEFVRVLKPGGLIVIANGSGRPDLAEAYQENSRKLRRFKKRFPGKVPETYSDFCRIFNEQVGTAVKDFISEDWIETELERRDITIVSRGWSPCAAVGKYITWKQFKRVLIDRHIIDERLFYIQYPFFSFLNRVQRKRFKGGYFCSGRK